MLRQRKRQQFPGNGSSTLLFLFGSHGSIIGKTVRNHHRGLQDRRTVPSYRPARPLHVRGYDRRRRPLCHPVEPAGYSDHLGSVLLRLYSRTDRGHLHRQTQLRAVRQGRDDHSCHACWGRPRCTGRALLPVDRRRQGRAEEEPGRCRYVLWRGRLTRRLRRGCLQGFLLHLRVQLPAKARVSHDHHVGARQPRTGHFHPRARYVDQVSG